MRAASDLGNFTVECQTMSDDGSAYEIHEVGLRGTNDMAARLMVTGTNSVNKGAAGEVNISYQIIEGTA